MLVRRVGLAGLLNRQRQQAHHAPSSCHPLGEPRAVYSTAPCAADACCAVYQHHRYRCVDRACARPRRLSEPVGRAGAVTRYVTCQLPLCRTDSTRCALRGRWLSVFTSFRVTRGLATALYPPRLPCGIQRQPRKHSFDPFLPRAF